MMSKGFATRLTLSIAGVLGAAILSVTPMKAADQHEHAAAPAGLVKVVREITEQYKDVAVAKSAGYALAFGCVSGPETGAMGLHYVNMPLLADGEIDANKPEIILYEPAGNDQVRLVGADYLVLADAWDKTHPSAPELMGQKFQQFEAPNRFGCRGLHAARVGLEDQPDGLVRELALEHLVRPFTGPTQ